MLAIVAFALFMSRMKEIHSIGFWGILPCALMLPIFFYSAVEIRRWPQGLAVLIFVTLGCTVNDVGAYFVGRAVGTHKLAPIISPGRTRLKSLMPTVRLIVDIARSPNCPMMEARNR